MSDIDGRLKEIATEAQTAVIAAGLTDVNVTGKYQIALTGPDYYGVVVAVGDWRHAVMINRKNLNDADIGAGVGKTVIAMVQDHKESALDKKR